jgi:hypothetical protein
VKELFFLEYVGELPVVALRQEKRGLDIELTIFPIHIKKQFSHSEVILMVVRRS